MHEKHRNGGNRRRPTWLLPQWCTIRGRDNHRWTRAYHNNIIIIRACIHYFLYHGLATIFLAYHAGTAKVNSWARASFTIPPPDAVVRIVVTRLPTTTMIVNTPLWKTTIPTE